MKVIEKFVWTQDLEDRQKELDEFMRKKDKVRRAKYYKKNQKKILRKRKRDYEYADRATYSKKYREENREIIRQRNKEQYVKNREKRLEYAKKHYEEKKEEILAKRKQKRLEKKNELQQRLSQL